MAAEQGEGTSLPEAKQRAVERFGSPADFVRQLQPHEITLRVGSLLGATGSLAVGLLIAALAIFVLPATNADQVPFWTMVSIGFSGYGALTWIYFSSMARRVLRAVLAFASVAGVAVGFAAIAHSLYRARVTGDWEAYVTLFGLVLSGHGTFLLVYLGRSRADWRQHTE